MKEGGFKYFQTQTRIRIPFRTHLVLFIHTVVQMITHLCGSLQVPTRLASSMALLIGLYGTSRRMILLFWKPIFLVRALYASPCSLFTSNGWEDADDIPENFHVVEQV
jgi:hypothetical protein